MRTSSRLLLAINHLFPFYFAVALLLILIPVITYHYYAGDIADRSRIMNNNDTGLQLIDSTGEVFFSFYEAKTRVEVPLKQIPLHLQLAVIAMEDRDFYSHSGYSIRGILRSAVANITRRQLAYGGSTITQQLVKNALLHPQKSFLRKYQEVVLASEIERRYTKDEILEMYLNSVYFGEGAFGVHTAAEIYFDKQVENVSLAEAAYLIGILPAPSIYSPLSGDREAARERQKLTLATLLQQRLITRQQYDQAIKEKVIFNTKGQSMNRQAPHFALFVRDLLIEKYGEENISRGGYKVYTTLDPHLQQFVQNSVTKHVNRLAPQNVSNGAAVVAETSTGYIKSMVGSVNWYEEHFGKMNMATTPRQPGSSFKPIVYALAMERNLITPATILHDSPSTFEGGYRPSNYDNRFRGNVTVRRALANSLNVPAVEVMMKLGVPTVLDKARALGIYSLGTPVDYGPSLVLGTGEVSLLEMTNVYATFAQEGKFTPLTSIIKIEDKYDKIIYQYVPDKRQVFSPQVSFLISSILSDPVARAEIFGNVLNIPMQAAVKTGTTEYYKDSWTLGYTPNIAVGVWIGNNDAKPMAEIAGSQGAAPIWKEIMMHIHEKYESQPFVAPEGIEKIRICANGLRTPTDAPNSYGYAEYFLSGTAPTVFCSYKKPEQKDENQPDNLIDREKHDNNEKKNLERGMKKD